MVISMFFKVAYDAITLLKNMLNIESSITGTPGAGWSCSISYRRSMPTITSESRRAMLSIGSATMCGVCSGSWPP